MLRVIGKIILIIKKHKKGIYVLSAAPAMAPAVAEACIGYAIALSRNTLEITTILLLLEKNMELKEIEIHIIYTTQK